MANVRPFMNTKHFFNHFNILSKEKKKFPALKLSFGSEPWALSRLSLGWRLLLFKSNESMQEEVKLLTKALCTGPHENVNITEV